VNCLELLQRQFVYDAWANGEVLAAMRNSGAATERSLQLVAHIVSAERLWLERIKQQPQSFPVWPKADLEQCQAQADKVGRRWREYLNGIDEGDLSKSITYKNTKGEAWQSTIGDILTHVILHAAYHRGQIASHMREKGQTPAYTDFIHGVRQGMVK
jgi:uncharacterized damage-inducible protein DinB